MGVTIFFLHCSGVDATVAAVARRQRGERLRLLQKRSENQNQLQTLSVRRAVLQRASARLKTVEAADAKWAQRLHAWANRLASEKMEVADLQNAVVQEQRRLWQQTQQRARHRISQQPERN